MHKTLLLLLLYTWTWTKTHTQFKLSAARVGVPHSHLQIDMRASRGLLKMDCLWVLRGVEKEVNFLLKDSTFQPGILY